MINPRLLLIFMRQCRENKNSGIGIITVDAKGRW